MFSNACYKRCKLEFVWRSIYCEPSFSEKLKTLDHELLESKRTQCLTSLWNMQHIYAFNSIPLSHFVISCKLRLCVIIDIEHALSLVYVQRIRTSRCTLHNGRGWDKEEKNYWIKSLFLFSLRTKSILVASLRLNHWCHMDYLNNVLTTFLSLVTF